MKTSITIVACMFFAIALLSVSCGSQQTEEVAVEPEEVAAENPLIGVWKITEVTFTAPDSQPVTDPQPGYAILSDKHMAVGTVIGESRPELPEEPTDAQLAAAYNSFFANFATYEVEGNIMTTHLLVNSSPNAKPGDTGTLEYQLEGDILTITPKTNAQGPIENPYTVKFARVE